MSDATAGLLTVFALVVVLVLFATPGARAALGRRT